MLARWPGTLSALSHLQAADGTVLCEHEDAHDDLHALLVEPAAPRKDGSSWGRRGGMDHALARKPYSSAIETREGAEARLIRSCQLASSAG